MNERVVVVAEDHRGLLSNTVFVRGREVLADEPPDIGGLGVGLDPFEFLLAGLGACTSMTLRLYAGRKGWDLEKVEVTVRQTASALDGAPKDVFSREIRLIGELSADERERLLQIAEACPVHRTLTRGVDIVSSLAAVGDEVGEAAG